MLCVPLLDDQLVINEYCGAGDPKQKWKVIRNQIVNMDDQRVLQVEGSKSTIQPNFIKLDWIRVGLWIMCIIFKSTALEKYLQRSAIADKTYNRY